jgi:hypothetical protein
VAVGPPFLPFLWAAPLRHNPECPIRHQRCVLEESHSNWEFATVFVSLK